ncbi:DUF2231 domain-containing protein [Kineococcus sp. GCM10028916]|uniref:DUF2231 domain-containing protein n=1 Tax=Kineococcus sp. GCM10028916 TaxID=3273394 RepID=UPI00362AB821
MLDTIDGLPVHPLVVHAVVVLLPLAVLGTILVAVLPRWRVRYGGLNALVAVIATALCPIATSSGEALEHRVGDPGAHAGLGDQLVWFALPMTLLAIVLWWVQRRHRADTPDAAAVADTADVAKDPGARGRGPRAVRGLGVVAVLSVVAAVAAGVQVYRVGDSGAEAVWADQMTSAPAQGSSGD